MHKKAQLFVSFLIKNLISSNMTKKINMFLYQVLIFCYNYSMEIKGDYLLYINSLNLHYAVLRKTFTKEDILRYISRTTLKDRMINFMSRSHYKRKELFIYGAIMYVYTFKINNFDPIYGNYTDTWVLYSPDIDFRKDPNLYKEISAKLNDFLDDKLPYKNKKLRSAIASIENSYMYQPLPKEISDKYEVYYNNVLCDNRLCKNIELGLNLAFSNKSLSKEMIYVPDEIIEDLQKNSEDLH
jgi:hypothetical protein